MQYFILFILVCNVISEPQNKQNISADYKDSKTTKHVTMSLTKTIIELILANLSEVQLTYLYAPAPLRKSSYYPF
ncbi:hypothetical protein BY458DRAFT_526222 [Sporodiniella umbellata]|nr:hypothetical protein BY458DRAFT_526222 [Sporodiniella umbellata]